ncbi:hypothetical protein BP6252_01621 [Coleophoma cylindrospora]|uniref:guanylate kinase n=1 Tax=Coleophoma cylindrospora TaxID=1849047 RepID=A0A3D8STE8_9HELO|nr:hypothetical protein BP6252_01621 [Coleophoma cylindrospora]
MAGLGVEVVDAFAEYLRALLDKAEAVNQVDRIEVPLTKSELDISYEPIRNIFGSATGEDKKRQYAVIETAVRDAFNSVLASTTIDSPAFSRLWNLLDIVSIFSDDEQCEPALLFWLVEELLDSQTIAGCRKVFDYLESRRERITAKHFSQKNLAILRSCNDLLRRLSRAEDTAFCGRVFMFMFQSFPLGERSTVNLRGEYHTENVTTFEVLPPADSSAGTEAEQMDLDEESAAKPASKPIPSIQEPPSTARGVTFSKTDAPMSADELYPIFWSLQTYLNQPKKLFNQTSFGAFKTGIEATMAMFKSPQINHNGRSDESKRGTKRKRSQSDDDLANAFNPKYLTSRDLFELEISDLSFRRNILVQVLIVLDFLLSLSAKAKEKLAKAKLPDNPNKSVMYADQVLGDEDSKWAVEMKKSIADYLKQGLEGPFFYRMVETVLSRDKNWVRWKIENCPSIAKPAVTPAEYLESKKSAKKTTTNKRIRPHPLGSLDLKFLAENDAQGGLERLKDPSRYRLPSIKSFQSKIDLDDMDIEMARDDESKNAAIEAKASKAWRALRIASRTKLVAFDKIERADKIDIIFQDDIKVDEPAVNGDEDNLDIEDAVAPTDKRPIAISGPSGVGKDTLVKLLLEKHPKSFGKKLSHTTRAKSTEEAHGKDYFFVTQEEFNILRDGDDFLEYSSINGKDYGTSRKVVEGIVSTGKVPIMEMDHQGIQQLKDGEFQARFIFLAPPGIPELEQRLKQKGSLSDESIKAKLKTAQEAIAQANSTNMYDEIIVNDELQSTFAKLESYIFKGKDTGEVSKIIQLDGAQDEIKEELKTEEIATPVAGNESAMEVDEKAAVTEGTSEAVPSQDTAPTITTVEAEARET